MAGKCRWIVLKTLEDYEKLVSYERQVYPLEDCITAQEYNDYLADGLCVTVLVDRSDWIVNYQLSEPPVDSPVSKGYVYIAGLASFKDHQRCGYGRKAMARIVSQCAGKNLVARVRRENSAPRKLLADFDFVIHSSTVRGGDLWDWFIRQDESSKSE